MSFMSKNNQTKVLSRLAWPTSLLASCINHHSAGTVALARGACVCACACARAHAGVRAGVRTSPCTGTPHGLMHSVSG